MEQGNFEFRPVNDEDEGLDYQHLKPCPHCAKPIPQNATLCLYCGEEVRFYKKPSWIVWAALIALISFILAGVFL